MRKKPKAKKPDWRKTTLLDMVKALEPLGLTLRMTLAPCDDRISVIPAEIVPRETKREAKGE